MGESTGPKTELEKALAREKNLIEAAERLQIKEFNVLFNQSWNSPEGVDAEGALVVLTDAVQKFAQNKPTEEVKAFFDSPDWKNVEPELREIAHQSTLSYAIDAGKAGLATVLIAHSDCDEAMRTRLSKIVRNTSLLETITKTVQGAKNSLQNHTTPAADMNLGTGKESVRDR